MSEVERIIKDISVKISVLSSVKVKVNRKTISEENAVELFLIRKLK